MKLAKVINEISLLICVFILLLEILDFNRPVLLQIPVHWLDAVLGSSVFHRGHFRVVQKVIWFYYRLCNLIHMHVGTLDFKCSILFLDEVTHSLNLDLSCKRWRSLDFSGTFLDTVFTTNFIGSFWCL